MFEFFFKYPAAAFSKGSVVLLSRWPVSLLVAAAVAIGLVLGYRLWQRRVTFTPRIAAIWGLQWGLLGLLLLLLWQPALSVSTLRPQQNVVAVVVDDSKSMALREDGQTRMEAAKTIVNSPAFARLKDRFQVRLYSAGTDLQRVENPAALQGAQTATRLGDSLKRVLAESASLPIGAVVLLSDGGENAGGIDLNTVGEIRRNHIPIHTIGFGRERPERDLEITGVELPARVLPDSRLAADVTLRQYGLTGRALRLTLLSSGKVLASREIKMDKEGVDRTERLPFNSGTQGSRNIEVKVEPVEGETNRANNRVERLLAVEDTRPRILYIEGEPKWEYKFIRRAVDNDKNLQLTSMIRTTQNKIYRQGVNKPEELEQGFPATVDELFEYQALIIGGVELNYFTPAQQELIRQFADRRGGGVLFLGGRGGLSDGGWAGSSMTEMLPVSLPDKKQTFRRDPVSVELTSAGRDHLLCRLLEDPEKNAERWKKLPYLQNFQQTGGPKPGAVVLSEVVLAGGKSRLPLLTVQNYGRGRTALFASAGSWRWQMAQPLEDTSHEMFWAQMMRWLVSGTNGRVISSTPSSVFADNENVPLRVEVRDRTYLPAADRKVEAKVIGPQGTQPVELQPDPTTPGVYTANYNAPKTGSYVVETVATRGTEETGRDVLTFLREDGVAENFGTRQNRELLEKISSASGGRYYKPSDAAKLPDEITLSDAGISGKETWDLWNMPVVFFLALAMKGSEWMLRRRWGTV